MPSLSHRMPSIRRTAVIAVLAGVAMVGAACSSNSSSPTTTAATGGSATTSGAPVTLRLGYLTNLTHASALIGVGAGLFKKNLPSNVTLQTST
jgi:NitT/TauT family transport system substrate-binding protein